MQKRLFTYWSGRQISALNIATVKTLFKYNPDVTLEIFTSDSELAVTWDTGEQAINLTSNHDITDFVVDERVIITKVDFERTYNIPNTMSANHHGDILRVLRLYESGGVWIDLDILFVNPIPDYFFTFEEDVLATNYLGTIALGVVAAKPQSKAMGEIHAELLSRCQNNANKDRYQSFGPDLWRDVYMKSAVFRTGVRMFGHEIFYPYMPEEITRFIQDTAEMPTGIVGVHWYNGSPIMRRYIKEYCLNYINFNAMPNSYLKTVIGRASLHLEFEELMAAEPMQPENGFTFEHQVRVGSSLRTVPKIEYFSALCESKTVLHIGCADHPITDPKTNLHLKLEERTRLLHGLDPNTDSFDILRQHLTSLDSQLFSTIEDLIKESRQKYDVVLIPEVMEHVDDIKEFLMAIDRIDFSIGVVTVPCAYLCSKTHFYYDILSSNFKELVHPDHNCWFSPYTIFNILRKYTTYDVLHLEFIDDISIMAVFRKS